MRKRTASLGPVASCRRRSAGVRLGSGPILCLLLLGHLGPAPSYGVTYGPVSDDELARQATVIAELDILATHPALSSDIAATEHIALVVRTLKGAIEGASLQLRIPGGEAADGSVLVIPGMPELREDDKVLAFLRRESDGTYSLLHLGLGLFYRLETSGDPLAVPAWSSAAIPKSEESSEGVPAHRNEVRDWYRFGDYLLDQAEGRPRAPDYLLSDEELEARGPIRQASSFRLFQDSGKSFRWPLFDQGQQAVWRLNPTSSFNTAASFRTALAVWTNERTTNIALAWGGESSATASQPDGENTVVFDDPGGELPGAVTCVGGQRFGGVLAFGGFFVRPLAARGVSTARGQEFWNIEEAFIVVNDGAECLLPNLTPQNRVELFLHELGHTLGLNHACGNVAPCPGRVEDLAVMRDTGHFDNRHHKLYQDDINAIATLYPNGGISGGGGGGGGAVVAPGSLRASARSRTEVELTWIDRSTNEVLFRAQIRVGNQGWQALGTTGADSQGALVSGLPPNTQLRFRLRAESATKVSAWSNIASVRTPQ